VLFAETMASSIATRAISAMGADVHGPAAASSA